MDPSNTVFGQHIIKLLISVAKDIKLLRKDIFDIKTSINTNMIELKTNDHIRFPRDEFEPCTLSTRLKFTESKL